MPIKIQWSYKSKQCETVWFITAAADPGPKKCWMSRGVSTWSTYWPSFY